MKRKRFRADVDRKRPKTLMALGKSQDVWPQPFWEGAPTRNNRMDWGLGAQLGENLGRSRAYPPSGAVG